MELYANIVLVVHLTLKETTIFCQILLFALQSVDLDDDKQVNSVPTRNRLTRFEAGSPI